MTSLRADRARTGGTAQGTIEVPASRAARGIRPAPSPSRPRISAPPTWSKGSGVRRRRGSDAPAEAGSSRCRRRPPGCARPRRRPDAPRARGGARHDRVKAEAADRNVERRQPAEHSTSSIESDFLVRFAQRRLLECFAGVDDAARQRDLTAVPPGVRPHRQHDVRAIVDREDQQQAGRMAKARRVQVLRPLTPRPRRQQFVRRLAGQRPLQTFANAIERVLEVHIVISEQLVCGAGNDEAVTARTTSAAISA